jgi:Yip1 domain
MWTKPRATIQQILDTNSGRMILLLAALGGVIQAFHKADMSNLGESMSLSAILTGALIGGSIAGIVGLYITSWLIGWTGKWLDGAATSREIRAALAWSSVPLLWVSLLWVAEFAYIGEELFISYMQVTRYSIGLSVTLFISTVIQAVGAAWALVAFVICLSQIQKFSVWKAVANTLLAGLVMVLVTMVLVFGIGALGS